MVSSLSSPVFDLLDLITFLSSTVFNVWSVICSIFERVVCDL
jgi:hypothetical protein